MHEIFGCLLEYDAYDNIFKKFNNQMYKRKKVYDSNNDIEVCLNQYWKKNKEKLTKGPLDTQRI